MSDLPLRCVVDTNVPTTANGKNPGAPDDCAAASARALQRIMQEGHLFVDARGAIVDEYLRNLSPSGEPGPGDAFLRWVLVHEYNEYADSRVTRVPITPTESDPEDYEELPVPDDGTRYDRSDRKFLAVAAAHAEHPPILQSFDSKWWGWRESLARIGVQIHFLCEAAIAAKHRQKMGR